MGPNQSRYPGIGRWAIYYYPDLTGSFRGRTGGMGGTEIRAAELDVYIGPRGLGRLPVENFLLPLAGLDICNPRQPPP